MLKTNCNSTVASFIPEPWVLLSGLIFQRSVHEYGAFVKLGVGTCLNALYFNMGLLSDMALDMF